MRDRCERLEHRQTEDCYIDTFLNPRYDSIFKALRFYFFDGGLSVRVHRGLLAFHLWALANRSSDWPNPFWLPDWPWLTDCSVYVYLCIYNFITSGHSFRLPIYVTSCRCSLVYTTGTSCLEILNWLLCQRSICNILTLSLSLSLSLSLTLPLSLSLSISQHPSPSVIVHGRSQKRQPVSIQNWWMQIFTGWSTLVCRIPLENLLMSLF